MNTTNTLNKVILGASVLSAMYLASCEPKNTAISKDDIVKTAIDSVYNIKYAKARHISFEPTELIWSNTKLIGKDEGFISCRLGGGGTISESNYGGNYAYSKYLFKNPLGEEVVLFGRDEVLFVGENYNINFYRLKPNTKLTSKMIVEALEDSTYWVDFNKNMSKDLEGVLNKYTRVKQ